MKDFPRATEEQALSTSPSMKRLRIEGTDSIDVDEILTSHVLGRVQQLLSYGKRCRLEQVSHDFAQVMNNFGWANVRALSISEDRIEHELFRVNGNALRCPARRLRFVCAALVDKGFIRKVVVQASDAAADLLFQVMSDILAHNNCSRIQHVSFNRAFDFVPVVVKSLCKSLRRVELVEFSLPVWQALSSCEHIATIKSTAPSTRMGYDVQEVSFSTAVTSALSGKHLSVLELVDLRLTTSDLTELLVSLARPLRSLSIQIRNPEAVSIAQIARAQPTVVAGMKKLSVRSFDLDDGPMSLSEDFESSSVAWFGDLPLLFPSLVELTFIGVGFGLTTGDLIAISRTVLASDRPRCLTMRLTVPLVEDSECERTVTDNDVDLADDLIAAFPDVTVTPMDPRVREQMELAPLSSSSVIDVSLDGRRIQRVTQVCDRIHEIVFALFSDEKENSANRASDGVYGWHDNEWSDSDEDEDADAMDSRLFSQWPMG